MCVCVCARNIIVVSLCMLCTYASVSCIRSFVSVCVQFCPCAWAPAYRSVCAYVCLPVCICVYVGGSVDFSACVCLPAVRVCMLCVGGGVSSVVTLDSRKLFHSPTFTIPVNVHPLPGLRLHYHGVVSSPWEVSCGRTMLTTSIPFCQSYSRAFVRWPLPSPLFTRFNSLRPDV